MRSMDISGDYQDEAYLHMVEAEEANYQENQEYEDYTASDDEYEYDLESENVYSQE